MSEQRFNRRAFLKSAGLTSVGLALAAAGCQPQATATQAPAEGETAPEAPAEQSGASAPQATKITFYHAWHQAIAGPVIDPMIKRYEEAFPGFTVEQTAASPDDLDPMILAAVAAGTPPDIAWSYRAALVQSGDLVPLDNYLVKYNYETDQVYPYLWEMFTAKGKKYGIPIENSSVAWWYIKENLQEAGVEEPSNDWDWNQMVDVGRKLVKKNGDVVDRYGLAFSMPDWWYFLTPLFQLGGKWFNEDLSAPAFNSEEGKKAMEFVLGMVQEGIVPDVGAGFDANAWFPAKKVGMQWDGPWRFGNYVNELKLDTNVVMHPKCPDTGSNTTYVFGGALTVCKTNEVQQDAAMQFLTWFLNKENHATWAVETGYLPVRKDVADTDTYKTFTDGKGAVMKTFLEIFDVAQAIPGFTSMPKFFDAVGMFKDECWDPVLLGERTVEEGLAAAEAMILDDPSIFERIDV